MKIILLIVGILGVLGILVMVGCLIAPRFMKFLHNLSLRKQRKKFEQKALKEENKVIEPYMFDDVWN